MIGALVTSSQASNSQFCRNALAANKHLMKDDDIRQQLRAKHVFPCIIRVLVSNGDNFRSYFPSGYSQYLLVEKNKWNDVSRDLHQAGEEKYQINVGVELRHVEGEPEVERAQGEPGQAAEGGVKIFTTIEKYLPT